MNALAVTEPRCASCGAPCGLDSAFCPGLQLPDGSVDYREAHSICSACLGVMLSSAKGLEAMCGRIERALAWRGHG